MCHFKVLVSCLSKNYHSTAAVSAITMLRAGLSSSSQPLSSSPSAKRPGGEIQHPPMQKRFQQAASVPRSVPAPNMTPIPRSELMRTGVFLTVATGSMIVAQFQPHRTRAYWKSLNRVKHGAQRARCTGAYDAIEKRIREDPNHTKEKLKSVTKKIGCASWMTVLDGAFMTEDDGGEPSYVFDKNTKCSPDCVWNRFTVKGDPDKDFVDDTASRLLLQSQLFMSDGTMTKETNPTDSWKSHYRQYVDMCEQYAAKSPVLDALRILVNKLPDLDKLGPEEKLDQYWAFIEYIATSAYDSYLTDDAYMTDIVKRGIKGFENQIKVIKSWPLMNGTQ